MLPLEGRPMLEYILHQLVRHQFTEVAINLHFLPDMIREYFGDGSQFGARLVYAYEAELLGTAGGVKNMAAFLGDGGPFLVHYGDIVTNQDFTALVRFHAERRALATLLVHQRARSNSAVSLGTDGHIVGFLERPSDAERSGVQTPWVFSGITICDPELLDLIPPTVACDFPRDVFPRLVPTGRLFGFPLSGERYAVDSPERLREARAAVRNWDEKKMSGTICRGTIPK
jgi:NDP-sugar pyrophosphorylase family protein